MAATNTSQSRKRAAGGRKTVDPAAWLERAYGLYHHRQFVDRDPLIFLYDYPDVLDREIVGLIASSLAYGRVASILQGVRRVLTAMQPGPRAYLLATPADMIRSDFRGFRYRVTSGEEMAGLLVGMKRVIEQHGTIEAALAAGVSGDEQTVVPAVGRLVDALEHGAQTPLKHLLPHPLRGSACKRLMLYLRWMVRQDVIDPGGWTAVRPSMLIMPLDTHVHRVSRVLRLTRRKQANLRTAMEITAKLRKLSPEDPLRYDFAMTRPGILGVES
jgi:uncharacterized protein (TIGR02757 family)